MPVFRGAFRRRGPTCPARAPPPPEHPATTTREQHHVTPPARPARWRHIPILGPLLTRLWWHAYAHGWSDGYTAHLRDQQQDGDQ